MMEILYKIVLLLHIVAGTLSLVSGFITMTGTKGNSLHRRSGRWFFYSMTGVCISAVLLSFIHPNLFLLHIGIFAFYQNYAGFRAVKSKSLKANKTDLLNLITGSINSLMMIGTLNPVLCIFGTIGALTAFRQTQGIIAANKNNSTPLSWLKLHIGMMCGAYISALTAFLVVNMQALAVLGLPPILVWTLPSMLIGPLAAFWTWKYTGQKETPAVK